RRQHAAEADVGHTRVRAAAVAGAGPVTRAIAVVAEEGPAALHALGHEWPGRVDRALRSGWVDRHPLAGAPPIRLPIIPVGAPLPHVAGHVVEPVPVWRVRFYRRRPFEAVLHGVLVRKRALPNVALGMLLRERLISPDVGLPIQPAAGRKFPLGLRGQAFSCPARIGDGIVPGDLDDGMIVLAFDVAVWSFGMPPIRTRRPVPPLRKVL